MIELSDGDTEDEEDKKPSAVEESNKPPASRSKNDTNDAKKSRRVPKKRARNDKSKSPYDSTPTEELVGTYCAAVSSKGWGDIFVHGMADELRTRLLDDEQFDRLKQATVEGLHAAAVRGETGDITPFHMDPYCEPIRSAERGQRFDKLMLLCPKKVKGKLISACPGAEDYDPNCCKTTYVLSKITNQLKKNEHGTDDVRVNCQCGDDGRCKKCNEDEGSARAEVYNRYGIFFYVTGGRMSFYNLGGTTTRIKENLVSKLDRHYFHTVFKNGYHLSCATYLVPCFPTFEYGATRMTSYLKHVCDMLGIPQAIVNMVDDDDIPMIVDPEQMAHHKAIWEDGLTRDNDNEGDIKSWKAENVARMFWLNTHCKEPTGSMSITSEFVLPAARSYADFFEYELLERNRVDSLDKVTVSMVQSMQSSHAGIAQWENEKEKYGGHDGAVKRLKARGFTYQAGDKEEAKRRAKKAKKTVLAKHGGDEEAAHQYLWGHVTERNKNNNPFKSLANQITRRETTLKKSIKKKVLKRETFTLVAVKCTKCDYETKGIVGNQACCLSADCEREDKQKLPMPGKSNNWEVTHEITGDERQRMIDEALTIDEDLREKDNERRRKANTKKK